MALNNKRKPSDISRRDFLKGAGLATGGLAAVSLLGSLMACKQSISTTTLTQSDATTTITKTDARIVTAAARTETVTIVASGANVVMQTPAPTTSAASGMSLRDAIKNRKSAASFSAQPIARDKLIDLLFNAWGINRPESGKRTAPSAVNAQEIDIYVFLADSVYIYDARTNNLKLVLAQDLRSKAITMSNYQKAPVALVYVADYAKFANSWSQSQKEQFSAAHSGFIGQNVYLYCAAEGLAARFHTSVDRTGLPTSLNLRADQAVIFGQVVGYP
jgi:hypothetical protein